MVLNVNNDNLVILRIEKIEKSAEQMAANVNNDKFYNLEYNQYHMNQFLLQHHIQMITKYDDKKQW